MHNLLADCIFVLNPLNNLNNFLISLFQGAIATTLTQPLDVLKTRAMNAKPGEFKGPLDLIKFTARQGPLAFYKGYVPAFVRLGPHTILTFVFFEQIRQNFGVLVQEQKWGKQIVLLALLVQLYSDILYIWIVSSFWVK